MASLPPMPPWESSGIPRWKEWFAWHPVQLRNGKWCWLVKIFRAYTHDMGRIGIFDWDYVSHKEGLLELLKRQS
jgi:hypothetical protein